ncbi:MAG: hypothetical protein AAGC58_10285 [Asticcacaulis sp.]
MHTTFKGLSLILAMAVLPLSVSAEETPHTPEAIKAVSQSLQTNLKAGLEAYQKSDYLTACTSLALAVGDGRTLRWHNEGLIKLFKAQGEDTREYETEIIALDGAIERLEARTKDVCALAQ